MMMQVITDDDPIVFDNSPLTHAKRPSMSILASHVHREINPF
jgi:hypothetical protein